MCCILNPGERKPDAPRFYSHLWYLLIVFIPFLFFLCYPFCCSLEMRPNRKGLDKNHKAQLGSPTQLSSAENEVANRWPNLKAELAESLEAVLLVYNSLPKGQESGMHLSTSGSQVVLLAS